LYSDSGGTTGRADNGAFGLSQLRGARQKEYLKLYGNDPNSATNQLQYAIDELTGKIPEKVSGLTLAMRKAILNSTGDLNVAFATIDNFLRPGPGTGGDRRRAATQLGYKQVQPEGSAEAKSQQITIEGQRQVTKEVALTKEAL